jgi:hypothetical protein
VNFSDGGSMAEQEEKPKIKQEPGLHSLSKDNGRKHAMKTEGAEVKTEPSNGHSHHKHHSGSHHRHQHHHKYSGDHHHHQRMSGSSSASESLNSDNLNSASTSNRELLVLSPTKIVIRDPLKSGAVKKKSVGHCGVQVSLKRRTHCKEVQTESAETPVSAISGQKNGPNGAVPDEIPVLDVSKEQSNQTLSEVQTVPNWPEKTNGLDAVSPQKQCNSVSISSHSAVSPPSKLHRSTQTRPKKERDKSHSSNSHHSLTPNMNVISDSRFLLRSEDIPEQLRLAKSPYRRLVHLEKYPNGGGLVAHAYQHELLSLSPLEREEFADQFLELVYGENSGEGVANCVMGIVHDAAVDMQDFVEYFVEHHPALKVKVGVLGKSDIDSCTLKEYQENVMKHYSQGTVRWGPLLQISLVGTVQEEVGYKVALCLSSFIADLLCLSCMSLCPCR